MRLRIAYIAVLGCALWQHGCGIEQNRSNGTARAPAGQVASTSVGDDFMGDRVYFLSLSVLSFSVDQYTASRRGSPHAQLTCTGGSAAGAFRVKLVDCYNIGLEHATAGGFSSGVVPVWHCIPSPAVSQARIAHPQITCEGYSYGGDEYVLKNSCYLEFELERVHDKDPANESAPDRITDQAETGVNSVLREMMLGGMAIILLTAILAISICTCIDSRPGETHLHGEQTRLLSRATHQISEP
jgi:SOCE-associated regulatory factor of calcium homoeostasis